MYTAPWFALTCLVLFVFIDCSSSIVHCVISAWLPKSAPTSASLISPGSNSLLSPRKWPLSSRHLLLLAVLVSVCAGIVALVVSLTFHKASSPGPVPDSVVYSRDSSASPPVAASLQREMSPYQLYTAAAAMVAQNADFTLPLDYYRLKIQGGLNVSLLTYK